MKTKNIVIDVHKTTGSVMICVDIKPNYEYVNGVKGKLIGYVYEVILPEKNYDTLKVKVDGDNKLGELDGGNCEVKFENLELKVSVLNNNLYVTGKASNVKNVEEIK